MNKLLLVALTVSFFSTIGLAGAETMAPDGTYVSGDTYNMAPDGTYVTGDTNNMAPDGTYVTGDN